MIDRNHPWSVKRQCKVLDVARSTAYYRPEAVSHSDLALLRRIDELHLKYPFTGSRRLRDWLHRESFEVRRRHLRTLMRRMGIRALYRGPRTTTPECKATIYPYLLKDACIERPNQVWATDISVPRQAA